MGCAPAGRQRGCSNEAGVRRRRGERGRAVRPTWRSLNRQPRSGGGATRWRSYFIFAIFAVHKVCVPTAQDTPKFPPTRGTPPPNRGPCGPCRSPAARDSPLCPSRSPLRGRPLDPGPRPRYPGAAVPTGARGTAGKDEADSAPLPAPALAEDRRTPALHTGTLHLAVRATSGGFGTRALSGVSCGDWLTGDLSQHDPHCSRCRQHTPASSARSPPA